MRERASHALDDPARRDRYVAGIFDLIAPRYDRFTRWFSYGMDAAWKRDVRAFVERALREPDMPSGPVILDLACGTGDLTIAAQRLAPRALCLGLDISWPMLRLARARATGQGRRVDGDAGGTHVAGADMTSLPLEDASVHLVTAGYAVRNAPSLDDALDEIARVLAPGGHLVTLDFFLPPRPLWRTVFLGYLAVAGWFYGWLWHRRPDVYVYIPRSIRRFVSVSGFERALAARGLRVTGTRVKLSGGVAVLAAVKRPRADRLP